MSRLWLFSVLLALLTVPLWAQDVPLLEQARRERDANHYARATELYREVLRTQGESAPVLAELSDVLEAQGHWQETEAPSKALPPTLPPNAARRPNSIAYLRSPTTSMRCKRHLAKMTNSIVIVNSTTIFTNRFAGWRTPKRSRT